MEVLRDARAPYDAGQSGTDNVVPLVGSMTGITKDVMLNLARAALSGRAKDFLTFVAVRSFGNAGFARRAGDAMPGTSCDFDLSEWAKEMEWDKANVLRIRAKVCALGIVSFEPSEPGQGVIRWNLDFSTWRVLDADYRKARYTRPGAGRKKQPSIVSLISDDNSAIVSLNTQKNQTDNDKESNRQRKEIKLTTTRPPQPASRLAPQTPKEVKNGRMEETTASAKPMTDAATKTGKLKVASDEREYRSKLLEAIKPLRGQAIVNNGQEWAAAGKFYRVPNGPAPIETVVALWEVESQRPKWETGPQLTLMYLANCYSAYMKSPTNYREGVERSRKAVRGDYDARGRLWMKPQEPPANAPHRLITADDANPYRKKPRASPDAEPESA